MAILFSCSDVDISPETELKQEIHNGIPFDMEEMKRKIREMVLTNFVKEKLPIHILDYNGNIMGTTYIGGISNNFSQYQSTAVVELKKETKLSIMTSEKLSRSSELTNEENELINKTSDVMSRAIIEIQMVCAWVWKVINYSLGISNSILE